MKNKKNLLCMLLAIVMVIGIIIPFSAEENHFTDVPSDHWAFNSIERAYSNGIVAGTSDTTYTPDGTVTNAQYIVMLCRAFYNRDLTSYTNAMTSPNTKWWRPAAEVSISNEAGFLRGTAAMNKGNADGEWHEDVLNQPINRYDMAQMMYNIMTRENKVNVTDADKTATHTKMSDWDKIPTNYQDAVSVCYAMGLIAGTTEGTFSGDSNMTRAQAAVVICRMLDAMEGKTDTSTGDKQDNTQDGKDDGKTNDSSTVNDVKDRGKSDSHPTTGHSDTANKNGYYTAANVDLGSATLVYDLLDMVNEARKEEGLSALAWVPYDEAEEYTLMRANELTKDFSHGRPNGSSGLSSSVIGRGQTTAKAVFDDWMASEGHKRTLTYNDDLYMCAAKSGSCWIITIWHDASAERSVRRAEFNYDAAD